jgi:hypothetical protein
MKWITRERPKIDRIACPRSPPVPEQVGPSRSGMQPLRLERAQMRMRAVALLSGATRQPQDRFLQQVLRHCLIRHIASAAQNATCAE